MPTPRPSRLGLAAVSSLVVTALCLVGLAGAPGASAATGPGSIAVSATPAEHVVHYTGTAPFNNGQTGLVYGQLGIDDPSQSCTLKGSTTLNDQYKIAVSVPAKPIDPAYDVLLSFHITWVPDLNPMLDDLALHVFGPDGTEVGSSDGSQPSETVNLTDVKPGTYTALVCAFQSGPEGQAYTGTVTALTKAPPRSAVAKGVTAPTYRQYTAPKALSTSAGEPSIGNSWKTGHTLFTSNTDEYDVAFDDARKTSTWTPVNVGAPNGGNTISLDPIGYTDSVTGRSFISQLLVACSGAVLSDDDFQTSTPSEGCGSGINGGDHQTFGGGPFPEGVTPTGSYPHAVYYCAQTPGLVLGDVAGVTGAATCARSDDGGVTFGTPNAVYHAQCGGLHGHVRVGPDGTVYLPNKDCGGKQGVAVSKDGGVHWTVRTIPGSLASGSDPAVSAGSDGTLYEGWSDGTGRALVAVSRDQGAHWTTPVDVGAPARLRNSEFAEILAGDGDRAAFAYLGTPTKGTTQPDGFGKSADGKTFTGGEWHLYVSTTYDRGAHWTTVDATPKDPVQRGCIWNSGGSNPCRNLLDFNDITMTKQGRVMVGFADGCVGPDIDTKSNCVASKAVSANTLVSHGAIVRQLSGKGLLKAYDAVAAAPVGGTTRATTPKAAAGSRTGGSLAATGGAPALAGFGALLLAAGWFLRRR
ncbi:MAG: sialidase family protein, partial [Mycobacteriales bacterium]